VIAGLIAFAVSIAAAGLVWYSWRKKKQPWAAVSGWSLAFASAILWSRALGPEIGVTYAVMVFICLVWVEVIYFRDPYRPVVDLDRRPYRTMHWPGEKDYFRHGMLFLLSVPGTGLLALMLSTVLVLYLPWSMPLKFAVAIFIYPILWGALGAWICAQDKVARPALVSAGLLVVASFILLT
jgi:hypothetical protein